MRAGSRTTDATTQTFTNPVNFGISAASQINAASGSLIFGGYGSDGGFDAHAQWGERDQFQRDPSAARGTIVKSGTGALNVSATATAIGADFSLNAGTTTLLADGGGAGLSAAGVCSR